MLKVLNFLHCFHFLGVKEDIGFFISVFFNKLSCCAENADSGVGLNTLKILSYNVWFREDLELHKRMKALGDIVREHSPDIICFQVLILVPLSHY